jgi:zinc transporter ZupT
LPYLLAALFSIHSLIAGFALGISHAVNKTAIATTFAIFSHKVCLSYLYYYIQQHSDVPSRQIVY